MRTAWLLALVAACSSTPSRPAGRPSDTGPLSEEQFKAMHALPVENKAPVAGTTIDLGSSKAYLSLPEGAGPFPAILVIHEWWGLNTNIELWADRLAKAGWAALAIDLYGGVVAVDRDGAMAAMKGVDDAKAGQIISAGLEFLASDPRVHASKRAVIGWCFGGGWSLQTALAHPELAGAIIYYGHLVDDPAKLGAIKARVLGIFGNKDQGIPPADVDKFEGALKQAGVRVEIHRYDADHAFANPSNPHYDQTNAADAWSHVMAFLAELKKPT